MSSLDSSKSLSFSVTGAWARSSAGASPRPKDSRTEASSLTLTSLEILASSAILSRASCWDSGLSEAITRFSKGSGSLLALSSGGGPLSRFWSTRATPLMGFPVKGSSYREVKRHRNRKTRARARAFPDGQVKAQNYRVGVHRTHTPVDCSGSKERKSKSTIYDVRYTIHDRCYHYVVYATCYMLLEIHKWKLNFRGPDVEPEATQKDAHNTFW